MEKISALWDQKKLTQFLFLSIPTFYAGRENGAGDQLKKLHKKLALKKISCCLGSPERPSRQ